MSIDTELLYERVRRLEGALAELADETHAVSNPGQLAGRGKPWLASLLADARSGVLGALEDTDARMPTERR